MSRQNEFDANRRLECETEITALRERIQQLQTVIVQQEQVLQQRQEVPQEQLLPFLMQPRDVIEQFRRLHPLNGNISPICFIRAVDGTFELCTGNQQLQDYGLKIICNEKIVGEAARRLGDIGDLNWNEIKEKILYTYQPRNTYSAIFNHCRLIKVRNLEELFKSFEKAKSDLIELFTFDPLKPGAYKPENIDRDLVDIMLEKIDGTVRAHVNPNESLQDIIMKYTKLKLLWDSKTIHYEHRSSSNYNESRRYNQNNNNNNISNRNQNTMDRRNYYPGNNGHRYFRQDRKLNSFTPHTSRNYQEHYRPNNANTATCTNIRQPYFNRSNEQVWYPQKSNIRSLQNAGGSRQSKMSTQTTPRSEQSAMEIDSHQHEINFITEAQIHNCP